MFNHLKFVYTKSKYLILVLSLMMTTSLAFIPSPANAATGITNIGHVGGYDTPRLISAESAATDISNNIYIAGQTGTIKKYDSQGHYITKFGSQGSANGQFDGPNGIAIDNGSNIYVSENGNDRVQKLDSNGNFLLKIGSFGTADGEFQNPNGVAIDSENNIYVVDSGNSRIQKFDSDGNFLLKWGSIGNDDGKFNGDINDISVDGDDNVYVLERTNSRIQKFDSDGNFLLKWGTSGTGNGEFQNAGGIDVDNSNNIYVSDDSGRVQKFDNLGIYQSHFISNKISNTRDVTLDQSNNVYLIGDSVDFGLGVAEKFDDSGTHLFDFGGADDTDGHIGYSYSVATDSEDNIYVVDLSNYRIQKFDSEGNFLLKWGANGTGDGEFGFPLSITVDPSDNIYVSDMSNSSIQKFDSDGNFLLKWGSTGTGDGEFAEAATLAAGRDGNIYALDQGNSRIQKFDSDGNFLLKWGSAGAGNGQFDGAFLGIAVGIDNTIYVADGSNTRIQKFNTEGVYIGQFGSSGTGDGEFSFPLGVTVGLENNVYVTDFGDGARILKFNSSGVYQNQYTQGVNESGLPFYPYTQLWAGANGRIYVPDLYNFRVEILCDNDVSNNGCALPANGSDTDQDNIPDNIENSAPNNGDANNDGTQDSEQSNVASFIDPVTGQYAVLQVSNECSITSVSAADESTNTSQDTNYNYPNGLMDFTLNCGTPGFTATVTQYYYGASGNFVVRKYNPNTNTYSTIDSASISNQTIGGQPTKVATYQVKDGSSLDLDGQEDGNIHDPTGLAQTADSLANTGQDTRNIELLAIALLTLGLLSSTSFLIKRDHTGS